MGSCGRWLVVALAVGCGSPAPAVQNLRPEERDAAPAPTLSSQASSGRPPEPEPVAETVESLPVPSFEPAVVVTASKRGAAPVLVVGHGAGGRPEPHCDRYRQIVRGRAFILCTRGHVQNKFLPEEERGYYYDGHFELGREVRVALAALKERYGDRIDLARPVYAGYSQGAAMGILYLEQGGAAETNVAKILLVDGGADLFSVGLAKKLKGAGVSKIAIVCGQASCQRGARKSAPFIEQGGVEARTSYAAGAGHTYEGSVAPLVEQALAWLVEDDPRWGSP
jgi:pimeloyl-ACP methyl ester carboxylesterase